MNELYEKSIKTLELQTVLSMLSEEAVCTTAKEQAMKLLPMTDEDQIRSALHVAVLIRQANHGRPRTDTIDGVGQCMLTDKDVVRHELVQRIVKAYEMRGSAKEKRKGGRKRIVG